MAVIEDFGFGRLRFGRGQVDVPLLVVLCEFEGYPTPPVPRGFATFAEAMLDRLLGPKPSTDAWFRQTFGHGFRLIGGKAWGPVWVPRGFYMVKDGNGVEQWIGEAERLTFIKQQACFSLQAAGLAAGLDTDHNLIVDGDELCLVVFDNASDLGAMNRWSNAVNLGQPPTFAATPVAVLGTNPNARTITHEVLHSFGADDLYGSGSKSAPLTVMSSSASRSELAQRSQRRLDPWHELAFGITAPVIRDITTPGSLTLMPAHGADRANRCLLLHDPVRGNDEFFLVQFRTPATDDTDDETYAQGWSLWQVRLDQARSGYPIQAASSSTSLLDWSINHLGSPRLAVGDGSLWSRDTSELRWLDGMPTGMRLLFGPLEPSSPTGTVQWELVPDSSRFREPLPQPMARPVATLSTPGLALEYGYELASWTDGEGRLHWAQWLDEVNQLPWGIPPSLAGQAHGSALTRGAVHGLALVVSSGSGVAAFCEAFGPGELPIPGAQTNFPPAACWHGDALFVAWQQNGRLMLASYDSSARTWSTDQIPDFDTAQPSDVDPDQWAAGVAAGRISDRSYPALCSTGDFLHVCWIGVDGAIRFRRCSTGTNWLDRYLAPGQPATTNGVPTVPSGDLRERVRTLPPGSVHPMVVPHRDATIVHGVALAAVEVDLTQVALAAFTDDENHINLVTAPYPPYDGNVRKLRSSVRSHLPPSMVSEGGRVVLAFQEANPSRALTFASVSGLDLSTLVFALPPPP